MEIDHTYQNQFLVYKHLPLMVLGSNIQCSQHLPYANVDQSSYESLHKHIYWNKRYTKTTPNAKRDEPTQHLMQLLQIK